MIYRGGAVEVWWVSRATLCTVRISSRKRVQVAGRSHDDILSTSCKQEATVPRESRSTARQRKVCREALRAPRCTCSADQAERVDEISRRSAVRLAAVHHCCDRRSMASPLCEAGTLQALIRLWRCPADPGPGCPPEPPEGWASATFAFTTLDCDMISKI